MPPCLHLLIIFLHSLCFSGTQNSSSLSPLHTLKILMSSNIFMGLSPTPYFSIYWADSMSGHRACLFSKASYQPHKDQLPEHGQGASNMALWTFEARAFWVVWDRLVNHKMFSSTHGLHPLDTNNTQLTTENFSEYYQTFPRAQNDSLALLFNSTFNDDKDVLYLHGPNSSH